MTVLPEHVFVRAISMQSALDATTEVSTRDMEPTDLVYRQNPQILKPWVSTYDLRLI